MSCLNQWSTIEVDGHRVDMFDPKNPTPPTGCVLFLHGHGRILLNENHVYSDLFQRHNLAAICPDGQRSWWLDRICPEFSTFISPQAWLRDRLVPCIQQRWNISPPQIALLGVSMGGQGILQLSYRHAREFPVVAAISPAVDFHQMFGQGLPLDDMFTDIEDARQATVVLNLHPLAWPKAQWFCCDPTDVEWIDGCARLGMKLSSSGILHERDLETSAGGHSWEYFNHMAPTAIDHILKGLSMV
ncbi:MAG: alpha/beta hydrolase-fold protein [Planctomycetaceae bacterium]